MESNRFFAKGYVHITNSKQRKHRSGPNSEGRVRRKSASTVDAVLTHPKTKSALRRWSDSICHC